MARRVDDRIDEAVLCALVAPWLPNASVDTVEMQTDCGCYSEWTQDPCYFRVTFRAPRPEKKSTESLSKIVSVIEPVIEQWARKSFEWSGCASCCGDDDLGNPNVSVRVIPVGDRGPQADAGAGR